MIPGDTETPAHKELGDFFGKNQGLILSLILCLLNGPEQFVGIPKRCAETCFQS